MYGQNIKTIRAELGLSQREFAEKLDVTRLTIARWESGTRTPDELNQKRLLQIAKENGLDTKLENVSSNDKNVSSKVDTLDTKLDTKSPNVSNELDTNSENVSKLDTKTVSNSVSNSNQAVSKNDVSVSKIKSIVSTGKESSTIEKATKLAQNGISIIATNADKIPVTKKWKPFQERIATESELKSMFNKPNAQGIATIGGAVSGGLEIIDFDDKHGDVGTKGKSLRDVYPSWAELVKSKRPELFAKLVINSTQHKGIHVRYRYDSNHFEGNQKIARAYKLNPEGEFRLDEDGKPEEVAVIETRGDGGYALCPPSPGYEMIQGDLQKIPTISKEERDFLIQTAKSFNVIAGDVKEHPTKETSQTHSHDELRPGDDFNQRGDHRALLENHRWTFVAERQDGAELWRRPGKDDKGWSATFNAIPDKFYVFSTNASPLEDGKSYDKFALYAYLEHNGDFGAAAKALAAEGYGTQKQISKIDETTLTAKQNNSEDFLPTFTEGWLARQFVELHGEDVRFCYVWDKWLIWTGRRWKIDNSGEVFRKAKDVIKELLREASETDDDKTRKLLSGFAHKSDTRSKYAAICEMAKCELPILPEDFDTDPMLFNCTNGTIDLRTGQLREHRRSDYITKLSPIEFNPNAKAPRWKRFLNEIFNSNQGLIEFLQRAVGYGLTAEIRENILLILYGTGANGKTTFLETLLNIFGDYGKPAEQDLLIVKRHEQHPTGIADLMGARFVSAQEVGEGKRLNEALVKRLTGKDKLKARFMRQDFFEFEPTHKIFMAVNHKPQIRGTDTGIWRRIRLIPFDVEIPEHQQDKKLQEKLMDEAAGILAWCVRGCLDWQLNGLGNTKEVEQATCEYRTEMDTIGNFIAECCIEGDYRVRASTIYENYREWCDRNGEKAIPSKIWVSTLIDRGYERKRLTAGYYWFGLGIVDDDVPTKEESNPEYIRGKHNDSAGLSDDKNEMMYPNVPCARLPIENSENTGESGTEYIRVHANSKETSDSKVLDSMYPEKTEYIDRKNGDSESEDREVYLI